MLRDLVIPRIRPSLPSECLEWSSDGQLAVVSNNAVVLFEPEAPTTTPTKHAKQLFRNPYKIDPETLPTATEELDITDEIISHSLNAPDTVIINAGWSESGVSSTKSNLLGIVTNKHYFYIFDTAPSSMATRFVLRHNFHPLLLAENGLGAEPLCKTTQAVAERTRVHSFSWSHGIPQDQRAVRETWVAIGKEDGSISLHLVSTTTVTLVQTVRVCNGWVVKTYWSPWIRHGATASSCILTVSSTNALHVVWVTAALDPESTALTTAIVALSPATRFLVATANWTVFHGALVLAVVSNKLQLFTFNEQGLVHTPQPIPLGLCDTVCSIVLVPEAALQVYLYTFQGLLLQYEYKGESTLDPVTTESVLGRALAEKTRKWRSDHDKEPLVNVYGARASPANAGAVIFAYYICEAGTFQYKTDSKVSTRVAFVSLADDTWSGYDEVVNATPVWYQHWLTVNASELTAEPEDASTTPRRDAVILSLNQTLIGSLESYTVIAAETSQTPQAQMEEFLSLNFHHNPVLTQLRLLNYSRLALESATLDSQIRAFLGRLVVGFIAQEGLRNELTTAADVFVYESFHHLVHNRPSLTLAMEIAFKNSFVEEIFEVNLDGSSFANPQSIVSKSNHSWPRCAVTSLPLLDLNNQTCSSCGKKLILKSSINADNRGWFTEALFEALRICVYCGGRLNRRKDEIEQFV